ncbi:MAG TPA: hypothetical protein VFX78_13795 [Candidatus Eisenbacteria bacterium]|nr:hypothetical protein [Candidatus Eisenbacteria bacterium]
MVPITGFRLDEQMLGQAVTSSVGIANLALPDSPFPSRVRAVGPGYVPAEEPLQASPPTSDVTVLLGRGCCLAGQVADLQGRGVGKLRIRITYAGLPHNIATFAASGYEGRGWQDVIADDLGRFRADGLAPGFYRVDVIGDGWRVVEPRPHPDPTRRIENSTVVRAGRENVLLKVEAIRVFRALLFHDGSSIPFDDPYTRVTVDSGQGVRSARQRGAETLPAEVWAGDRWLTIVSRDDPPGVVTGVVAIEEPLSPPTSISVRINAIACKPTIATVTLRLPSALAQGPEADEIHLAPADEFGSVGVLRIRCEGPPHGFYEDPRPRLEVRRKDHILGFVRGFAGVDGRWEFERVPSGAVEVRLHDGATATGWEPVNVDQQQGTSITLKRGKPQGATITLRDESGTEVFEADTCAISILAQGQGITETGTIDRMYTEYLRQRGSRVRAVLSLDPGWYRCDADKMGYVGSYSEFEVRNEEVTEVVVTLRTRDASRDD